MQINLVWLRFSLSARGSTEVLFMLHTRLCQSVVRHLGRSCCCLVAKTAYCIGFYELQINFKKEAKKHLRTRAGARHQSVVSCWGAEFDNDRGGDDLSPFWTRAIFDNFRRQPRDTPSGYPCGVWLLVEPVGSEHERGRSIRGILQIMFEFI